ncbi:hypothetical protein E4P39_19465 [Blastococcus sp. CT_GayMR19]|uniref:hypothetical protein n=1 Tax=Blastococcus sp. CT_GayMR19 TaxID=2559608 RepID=UPI00107359A3|nr:hypothetical protein [Blastococcus sp. CT_GayMR19]TFV70779.1 hypothetical protein E4P39_19465 [Blastococcus sp. CT_GayMR19]
MTALVIVVLMVFLAVLTIADLLPGLVQPPALPGHSTQPGQLASSSGPRGDGPPCVLSGGQDAVAAPVARRLLR